MGAGLGAGRVSAGAPVDLRVAGKARMLCSPREQGPGARNGLFLSKLAETPGIPGKTPRCEAYKGACRPVGDPCNPTKQGPRRQYRGPGEHFTVDGTLLESWASLKSFRPKDGEGPKKGRRNPEVDFRGEQRKNDSPASTTDPKARLARKGPGKEAKLCFAGHVLMENRNGLVLGVLVTEAKGRVERQATVDLISRLRRRGRITLEGDKNYDTVAFVAKCRDMKVTPPGAQNTKGRASAVDGRTTRHPG